ncbi:protein split ends-like [Saccostrea echinata]|uniref:protein split ends-like n=1 Tax=Saccostrea echinata TaxID=191078 RepID=UPI002A80DB97|nr:protein split ends-like [Saccostrea echinata]
MDESEVKPSSGTEDVDQSEEENQNDLEELSELSGGNGWRIPDEDSTGSTAHEEADSVTSRDGSQKVFESMFTDSDGGSTIKMNEQCHSDATQTGENEPTAGGHSPEVKEEQRSSSIDPNSKITVQSDGAVMEKDQLIVTERELNEEDGMSDTSDVVNNNDIQSPREISPEEQAARLEKMPPSNKFKTVASSGSLFSEDGYQTFPGADQSRELLKREVYGREEDSDSEAVSSCTDTSHLAQLIVDHVLDNVVGSIQDESDSDTPVKELLEKLEHDAEMEEELDYMDQGGEDQVTEDKEYASKMELESDLKPDEDDMTDFQLDEPQPAEEECMEENDDRVKDGGDEEIESKLEEDNTVFDTRGGGAYKVDPQLPMERSVPDVLESPKTEETMENKILENGRQVRLMKSKDSGVSMSYASESDKILQSRSIGATSTGSEIDKVNETVPERSREPERVSSDLVQEYDTQRPIEQTEERGAEKPYEISSSFKELIPEDITRDSVKSDASESVVYPKDTASLAYTTVSSPGYIEPSSINPDQSSLSVRSQKIDSVSYDRNSSPARAVQTPPRMVLRTKKEFVVEENRPERDANPDFRSRDQQNQREVEMLREQMILDKVRKDMAAKEREMRRQIDREMNERMERARLEQELLSTGGEYYRSENDLSHSTHNRTSELDTSESSRLKYTDKVSSRSPVSAASLSMSVRGSSDVGMSEDDLIRRYQRELSRSEQRELSRSEQREQRQYDVSGIDTYATLQNPRGQHDSLSSEEQHRLEGMSYADMSQHDSAVPASIYSSYNIPPPQYNVSTSFGAQNSSHTSSDLEAPPPKSGSVPPFKTLHEQQMGWMRMFKTIEEQHHNELKNQYRQHQETIFSMQHHLESELLNQQQILKQRLSAHKEALSQSVSPIKPSQDRRLDHSELANASQMLESTRLGTENSYKKPSQKSSPRSRPLDRSPAMERHSTPPWKEIYREIRGKGIDSDRETEDNEEETTPVRRSLEEDFMSPSSTLRQPPVEEVGPPPRKSYNPPPSEFPRGGVFSSPMPILRKANVSQSSSKSRSPRQPDRSSPRVAIGDDLSHRDDSRLLDSRSRESSADAPVDSLTSEEFSSQRANLREKHAKHLSDLREYYEQEILELRGALSRSDDITNRSPFKRVASENQALITENHSLKHANEEMESQLNVLLREKRELEQKVHGLERRASEYADHYKEAQDKISTFRNKVEELQYQNRTLEDQNQHLECQIKNQTEAIKHYKKTQDEQIEMLQKDRNAYHKLVDKYESLEREFNVLKESFNVTENKLYDARSEVVELNRTVSKLELENKRLGRENDNLRHKLTQSANAVSIQGHFDESYGSPGRLHHPSPDRDTSHRTPYGTSADETEIPVTHSRSRSQEIPLRTLAEDREVRSQGRDRSISSERNTECRVREGSRERRPKNTCNTYAEVEEMEKSRQRPKSAPDSRSTPDSRGSPGVEQTSPVLRAERELYKLREIMRQADKAVESSSPPQPKLQKKFYGSESRLSVNRSDSGSSVSKSDSSTSPKIRKNKSVSTSSVRSQKVRSSKSSRYPESNSMSTPSKAKFETSPSEFDSPTRFDVRAGERSSSSRQYSDSTPTRDTGFKARQNSVHKDKRNGEVRGSKGSRDRNSLKAEKDPPVPNGTVESTLHRVKEGDFVSRPEWEDIYTSMAKPKPDSKIMPIKQTVKNHLSTIPDLEARYDELQTEKKTLESQLSRVPSHGKGRQQKETIEEKLDEVEKELGSVRMSLKRYHVLKTSI